MELPIERFTELGNILYLALKHDQFQEKKVLGYLAYVNVQLQAGKKAPSPQEFERKQGFDSEPELEYLWRYPQQEGRQEKQGDAQKAARLLEHTDKGAVDLEGKTENEQRAEAAEAWGNMSVADLQAYKAKRNSNF